MPLLTELLINARLIISVVNQQSQQHEMRPAADRHAVLLRMRNKHFTHV